MADIQGLQPGVYTQTNFNSPVANAIAATKIPVLIGEGSEILAQSNQMLLRGSSSDQDQKVTLENEAGRAVLAVSVTGAVTLGNFDGVATRFQVRNYPITNGAGSGATTNDRSKVSVLLNGQPIVVQKVEGATGIITLTQAPLSTDVVRCTYYFHRGDSQFTDNLSDQVGALNAELYGEAGVTVGAAEYRVVANVNDTLVVTLLNSATPTTRTIVFPAGSRTASELANLINAAAPGITASVFVNSFGKQAIKLSATTNLLMGSGNANGLLGFVAGQETTRPKTFYTFQGPIVDGSGGGVTTTDVSKVSVKINNVAVLPVSVNGQTRAVTLPYAPPVGATVAVSYWANTWQDTFDYLPNIGVTEVVQCGATPDRADYANGADYILKNDTLVWGTAALVSGTPTIDGSTEFGTQQISTTLVDYQRFLSPCTPAIGADGYESRTDFQLSFQPTTGNGRGSPLGQSLFQTVSNGRMDLPTDRPDLVTAYWGYSVQDALDRGPKAVIKVDSATSQITLAEAVPAGASVYANFYYNQLVDSSYVGTVALSGVTGVGTYTIATTAGTSLYNAHYDVATKSASLTGITINFPSGSEYNPGFRFEGSAASTFVGPVDEIVTVKFKSLPAKAASFTVPGAGAYSFIENASDQLYVKFDSLGGMVAVDLADPNSGTLSAGSAATLVSSPAVYDAASGGTTFDVTTGNNHIVLTVDGVQLDAKASVAATTTLASYVNVINEAANGRNEAFQAGGGASTAVLDAAASTEVDYYVGWKIIPGTNPGLGTTAGKLYTVTAYDGAGLITVTPAWDVATPQATQTFYLYNPNALVQVAGSTKFTGQYVVGNTKHDRLTLHYHGATTGDTSATITLASGTYATPSDLATQVQTQLDAMAGFNHAAGDYALPEVTCEADSEGRLLLKFRRALTDAAGGYFEFVKDGTANRDFAVIAGLCAGVSASTQSKYMVSPIARRYTTTTGGALTYDRIVVRGRLQPGLGAYDGSTANNYAQMSAHNVLAQSGITVLGGSANDLIGLPTAGFAEATNKAVVAPASLFAAFPQSEGQYVTTDATYGGEYVVKFYDGTGTQPANNIFAFTLDGVSCQVTFAASDVGTDAPLGSNAVAPTDGTSVLGQINSALGGLPGTPFGNAAAVASAQLVRRDGVGLRITSATSASNSSVQIGSGSANTTLGFSTGASASRTLVSTKKLVSALMNQTAQIFVGAAPAANSFAAEGIAYALADSTGREYLYVESNSTGTASRIEFLAAASNDALRYNTGLGVVAGQYSVGEAAKNGFVVYSSNPAGSGSANTSTLNSGVGQDGVVGQTYTDDVTGLTFTILKRDGNLSYPANGTFRVTSSTTFTTNGSIPVQIPGVELLVTDTYGCAVGNTAVVDTFKRGGAEPAIGDAYYVSYLYEKQDFTPALYSKLSTIEQAFGDISPDNPVSLAAYLTILNGGVLVGIAQAKKAANSDLASVQTYRDVLDSLNTPMSGNIKPDVIVPLRGDSTEFFQYLSMNVSLWSDLRHQMERTALIGVAAGTTPEQVGNLVQLLGNARVRVVYPDTLTMVLTNALGTRQEYLVEGYYAAAAVAGNRCSPAIDVATPWTHANIVGFTQVARKLDAVQQNQIAQKGVTILEDNPPFIRIRQGLTTDMTNILTKLPTIIQIADEIQKQARQVLSPFIGQKFIPGVLSQIEGRLSMMLKGMVAAQIISAFQGVQATLDPADPTTCRVQLAYAPVFPLLYIVIQFNVRSSLNN